MADRFFQQFQYRLEKGVVTLHAHVAIGASGAPTLQAWNPATAAYTTAGTGGFSGIKSIARTSAGLYTVTLQNSYQRLLGVEAIFALAGGLSVVADVGVNTTTTNVRSATAPTVGIACMTATATAGDPDSGCQMDLEITLTNSSAL